MNRKNLKPLRTWATETQRTEIKIAAAKAGKTMYAFIIDAIMEKIERGKNEKSH